MSLEDNDSPEISISFSPVNQGIEPRAQLDIARVPISMDFMGFFQLHEAQPPAETLDASDLPVSIWRLSPHS